MREFRPGYVNVTYSKEKEAFRITNELTEESYISTPGIACFLSMLDGRRDPFEIGRELGWNEYETADILLRLVDDDLVRESRIFRVDEGSWFGTYFCTLWTHRRRGWTVPARIISLILTFLILFACIPVLIAGIMSFIRNPFITGSITYALIPVIFFGSIWLHEFAGHFIAGIAFNAPIYEAGLMIQGAYVLVDDSRFENKWKKAQIAAAGIEVNFLVAGIGLILAASLDNKDFLMLGLSNLCLGLTNLAPLDGLDGNGLASSILDFDLAKTANKVFHNPAFCKKICHEKHGAGIIAVCCLIRFSQFVLMAGGTLVMVFINL